MTYLRNANPNGVRTAAQMDDMAYSYYSGTNKLNHVTDAVNSSYTTDIEDIETQSSDNYDYDEIGNLISDAAEGISSIEWTVYGKIAQITKTVSMVTTTILYTYDATGNRISKRVIVNSDTTYTWYVRDASGNVMAVYERGNTAINGGNLSQTELHLYGSSRLGLWRPNRDVQTEDWELFEITAMGGTNGGQYGIWERGQTGYELSNHLQNVLVTISDKKIGHDAGNGTIDYYTADVVTANDYYPFGSQMPGRKYSSGTNYRYGFNGKENDNEVKGEGNQQDYGMRIYDTRLGRFLSVDPLTKSYPHYTPYSYAGNKPIQFIDLDGGEEKKSWWQYDFRDLMEWGRAPTNPLKDDGFVHSLATDVNRTVNPIYNAAVLVAGEENLGAIPSFYTPMTRTDAAFNLTTMWMGWRFAKLASTSNAPAQMEKQMGSVSMNTASKHPTQQAALGLTNEEKQKVIAWIKQQSSTGAPIKSFASPGNSVVLGKDFTGKLANQASEVGGFHFGNWGKPFGVQGQTFSNQFFGVLNQITKSGGKIFLDLEKVNIELAKKGVGTFAEAAEKRLATEWELNQILNNKDYLKNTVFHENGKVLTAEELAKKGIK